MPQFTEIKYINLCHRTDRKELTEKELKRFDLIAERVPAIYIPNSKLGCNASHLKILRDGEGDVLIFEDDIWLSDYFAEIYKVIEDLPKDWDLFYLGANHRVSPEIIKGNLAKAIEPYCTHAYAVSSRIRKELINILENDKRIIDSIYVELIKESRIKAYCSYPPVVYQRPNLSDLEGRFMEYDFMIHERDKQSYNKRFNSLDFVIMD